MLGNIDVSKMILLNVMFIGLLTGILQIFKTIFLLSFNAFKNMSKKSTVPRNM